MPRTSAVQPHAMGGRIVPAKNKRIAGPQTIPIARPGLDVGLPGNASLRAEEAAQTCERGGGCAHLMHGRSRMAIDPRIPTLPGRGSTSGFH